VPFTSLAGRGETGQTCGVTLASSNFLAPTMTWPSVLAAVLVLGLLTLWPLVEAASRRRWGWFWATVVLGPLAGAAWFVVGRRRSHGVA
jgi:hypothetical protein